MQLHGMAASLVSGLAIATCNQPCSVNTGLGAVVWLCCNVMTTSQSALACPGPRANNGQQLHALGSTVALLRSQFKSPHTAKRDKWLHCHTEFSPDTLPPGTAAAAAAAAVAAACRATGR